MGAGSSGSRLHSFPPPPVFLPTPKTNLDFCHFAPAFRWNYAQKHAHANSSRVPCVMQKRWMKTNGLQGERGRERGREREVNKAGSEWGTCCIAGCVSSSCTGPSHRSRPEAESVHTASVYPADSAQCQASHRQLLRSSSTSSSSSCSSRRPGSVLRPNEALNTSHQVCACEV